MIAPNSYIREHVHAAQESSYSCSRRRGDTLVNRSAERPLKMCWVMMPDGDDGLADFFACMGCPRRLGEPALSLARPADVERIRPRPRSAGSTRDGGA